MNNIFNILIAILFPVIIMLSGCVAPLNTVVYDAKAAESETFYFLEVSHTNDLTIGYRLLQEYIISDSVLLFSEAGIVPHLLDDTSGRYTFFNAVYYNIKNSSVGLSEPDPLQMALCYEVSPDGLLAINLFDRMDSQMQDSLLEIHEKKSLEIEQAIEGLRPNFKFRNGHDRLKFKFYRFKGRYELCSQWYSRKFGDRTYACVGELYSIETPNGDEIKQLKKLLGLKGVLWKFHR